MWARNSRSANFCFILFVGLGRVSLLGVFASLHLPSAPASQGNPPPPQTPEVVQIEPQEEGEPTTGEESNDDLHKQTDAERIAELQDTIKEDREQLAKLEMEIDDPKSEYALAEKAFHDLNEELDKSKEELAAAEKELDASKIEKITREIQSQERQRKLAQERFDLAIESKKTLRDEIKLLKSKLKRDQEALDELTGDRPEKDPDSDSNDSMSDKGEADSQDRESEKSPDEEKSDKGEDSNSAKEKSNSESEMDEEEDAELMEAEAIAKEKEEEAKAAEEETQTLEARIADLQKLVNQEQKELSIARRKADLASAEQMSLNAEIAQRQAEQADAAEIASLRSAVNDASQRLIKARLEVTEISERLNDRRAELSGLQSEHIVSLHEAKVKQEEAAAAESAVEALRNPFAIRNMLQWVLDHGAKLVAIIVGMFLLNRIASLFASRSVRLVTASTGRGTPVERENRARTLVGVFQNAASVGIFITGSMMVLEEVGANITVLMGGVAVIGLAVAFGAQNLIKDYFYGFVMLLENQYMLHDSIQIGSVSGQVERITLRMTVLRDANGVVHFIPNGTINSVSNETHGWSRAVCLISIGYEEDLDNAMEALRTVASDMRKDPRLGEWMLEEPVGPTIDELGESSIQLKMSVRTMPAKQGTVKQEWLKRIHATFTQMGIEPAYPRRKLSMDKSESSIQASPRSHRAA